jgi:ABC-type branched-chain amino acid transport systems, ATPase component
MQVLYEVNLTVIEGEAVVVFGSNGSGKSTLMKVISGVLKPWSGTIRLSSKDITNLRPYDRVKMGISFASDMRNLFLSMSVEENLILGAYTKKEKVKEMLERVYHYFPELADVRKKLAGELSGGFQRMLSIGRALMSAPKLLMMTSSLWGSLPKWQRGWVLHS